GSAPAALGQIFPEHAQVAGHARAGVDEDGITRAHEIRVGPRTRHHARIEPQHASHTIARRGALWKIRIDPAHATPRSRRITSSFAWRPLGVPSHTICPLLITYTRSATRSAR